MWYFSPFHLFIYFPITSTLLCTCVWYVCGREHTCHSTCVEVRGSLFHYVGPRDELSLQGVGNKHHYLLSHPIIPSSSFQSPLAKGLPCAWATEDSPCCPMAEAYECTAQMTWFRGHAQSRTTGSLRAPGSFVGMTIGEQTVPPSPGKLRGIRTPRGGRSSHGR